MFSTGAKYDTQQIENVVLAYCFNSRMAFSSVENMFFKRAFKASLPFGVRSAKTLKEAILAFGIKLEMVRTTVCKDSLVAAQVDGGKSITKEKLFAFVIVSSGVPFLQELFNTKLERLDTGYYTTYLTRVMMEFEKSNTFCVSITMDNEAAMNAGTRVGLETVDCLRHLIHFRCGAHTLELVMTALGNACEWIQGAIDIASDVSKMIRSRKALSKRLFDMQQDNAGSRPLGVFLSNNTRKWSSGILFCVLLNY
jgi:hypothetical protein